MISVNPPSGFRDFINQDAVRRNELIRMISDVYQSFGFSPLETPVLENLDLLLGSGGGENEKLIFKILKRGEKFQEALATQDENQIAEFGLRFDLTLPLSRAVAAHRGKILFPWKVFHIGPVWRAERAQKGRFREFIQCDVDIIGAKGWPAEVEVIQTVSRALEKVGAPAFELRINDRRLIQAYAAKFGFEGTKLNEFAIILDKKDKLEMDELVHQLQALSGSTLSPDLLELISGDVTLDSVQKFHPEAAADLKSIIETLHGLDLPLSKVVFDPSLVRGLGYYTGPVFEFRHSSAGYSFGGGGRYDRLIGRFSNQDIPACGLSIGFERLALLLAEKEAQNVVESKTVFIPVFSENLRPQILKYAQKLRKEGLVVDVYPDQAKIKNQFKYASDSKYRWVLILGDQEWQSQVFKLKDFQSGTEEEIPENQLLKRFEPLKKITQA